MKIIRTRSWPLYPFGLPADVKHILEDNADEEYRQETLAWTDVGRFPDESPSRFSTSFDDPAAGAALDAFRTRYRELLAIRRHAAERALDQPLRARLEALGYLEDSDEPNLPAGHDFRLPPPGDLTAGASP